MNYAVFLFFFPLLLIASPDFSANLQVSNTRPVVKEAVLLKLYITLRNTKKFYRFQFQPSSTKEYRTLFLESFKTKSSNGNDEILFHVALFPLHQGKITPKLSFTAEETTQDEVKKFVTGSADELTDLRTKKQTIPLPPVTFNVAPLAKGTKLVGDFTLTQQLDKTTIKPNEQVNMLFTLAGRGYPPEISEMLNISKTQLYTDHETFHDKLFTKKIYRYALITDHNVTIPSIHMKAYNPANKRYYTLQTEPISIRVLSQKKQNKTSFPIDRINLKNTLNIIVFALAGILLAIFLPLKHKNIHTNPRKMIARSKTFHELLHTTIFLSKMYPELEKYQQILETHLYGYNSGKTELSLRKFKRKIIRQLESHT